MKRYVLVYLSVFLAFIAMMWLIVLRGEQLVKHTTAEISKSADQGMWAQLKYNLEHPLSKLLLQIIVILVVARLVGVLAKRSGLPSVVGEMFAGIILGPSLFGWLLPEASAYVFTKGSLQPLQFLSQIGLILFMFVIGMELDIRKVQHRAKAAVVISHASIVFPYFLGMLLAYFLYQEFAATRTGFLSFALFMGIAMSITAFPVLARILQERKLTQTPLGSLAITCAAADDVTAWCILAVVIAIVKAGGLIGAVTSILLAAVFVFLMLFPVRRWVAKSVDYLSAKYPNGQPVVALSFFVLLTSAWLAEIIGIHALFGAFIAGVIMPQNTLFKETLTNKVEDLSVLLLLPVFFAFTGLRTEIGLLTEGHYWWTCILITLVAVIGKFGGSFLAARWVGQDWKDSLSIGILMNTRGLMELIVLNIGYDLGILSPEIFAMLVIMAILTTVMTGPLMDLVEFTFRRRNSTKAEAAG